jgi:hypothetical protein
MIWQARTSTAKKDGVKDGVGGGVGVAHLLLRSKSHFDLSVASPQHSAQYRIYIPSLGLYIFI